VNSSKLLIQAREEGYQADQLIERTIDILTVKFGVEILKLIEGRVSTEVDASLSYDTEATLQKARELSKLYQDYGIDPSRVLIKLHRHGKVFKQPKYLKLKALL
jgi:transaldolase